jgi:hypothetical protein
MHDAPCNTPCPADQQLYSTGIYYYENVLSRINTLHIRLLPTLGQWITPYFAHLSTPHYVQTRFISNTIWYIYFGIVWQSDLLSCLSPRSGASIIRSKVNRDSVFWSQEFFEKLYTSRSPQCAGIVRRPFGLWKVRQISGSQEQLHLQQERIRTKIAFEKSEFLLVRNVPSSNHETETKWGLPCYFTVSPNKCRYFTPN